MAVVFSQAAPFSGAAYQYLRADDALPATARSRTNQTRSAG